jgi:hypothetical protein
MAMNMEERIPSVQMAWQSHPFASLLLGATMAMGYLMGFAKPSWPGVQTA